MSTQPNIPFDNPDFKEFLKKARRWHRARYGKQKPGPKALREQIEAAQKRAWKKLPGDEKDTLTWKRWIPKLQDELSPRGNESKRWGDYPSDAALRLYSWHLFKRTMRFKEIPKGLLDPRRPWIKDATSFLPVLAAHHPDPTVRKDVQNLRTTKEKLVMLERLLTEFRDDPGFLADCWKAWPRKCAPAPQPPLVGIPIVATPRPRPK